MLAEIAAANAAFAVIKTTLKNGRELIDAGQALVDYFKNKDSLQKSVNEKKTSKPTLSFAGKGAQLEEFLAQEQALSTLKRQEEELRELMIYHGRPGLWDDWLKFQAEYRKKEREEKAAIERAKAIKRQEREEIIEIIFAFGIAGLVLGGFLYLFIKFYPL